MNARAVLLLGILAAAGVALFVAFSRGAQAAVNPAAGAGGESSSAGGAAFVDWIEGATQRLAAEVEAVAESAAGAVEDAVFQVTGERIMSARWIESQSKPEYQSLLSMMRDAEDRHGIPRDLVVRLAWQESRWNPSAHNVGSDASGIMQIVPRWHPGVNVWDAGESIDYGAGFLRKLFNQFGSWELALKAYNWGPGNVAKWLASGRKSPAEPLETQNYSSQILGDLAAVGRVIA